MFLGSAVAAYFDTSPATNAIWSQLKDAATRIPVLAVFDEPAVLAPVHGQLVAAGVNLYGYVFSNQGQQPLDQVQATIEQWFAQYPNLSGMFVDVGPPLNVNNPEQQEPPEVLAYYQSVYQSIHSQQPAGRTAPAPQVILNCGGLRDAAFAASCLDIAMWEQDYPTYQNDHWWQSAISNGGAWWTDAATTTGKQVAHLVNQAPEGALQQVINLATQRGANYIYVYDGNSSNYGHLPAYWEPEVAALADLADDPGSSVLRPQLPVTRWRVHGAADEAAALARAVQQPQAVDASAYIWAGATGAIAEVVLTAVADPASSATAWFYANAGPTTGLLAEVVLEGQVLASERLEPGSGFGWHQLPLPQGSVRQTPLHLRFTSIEGSDTNIRAAYVELTGA